MGKGTLIKAEEIAAMIVARWAGQALVLWGFVFLGPEARGACVSRHAKTDPPQSIIFISISQQNAKIHSCSPVFARLFSLPCRGHRTTGGVATG